MHGALVFTAIVFFGAAIPTIDSLSSSSPSQRPATTTSSSSSSSSSNVTSRWKIPPTAQILHEDPLIYTIPNLLSPRECQDYQERVIQLQEEQGRPMTRSNPPQVSLDRSKLWPLPFLSLGAGIPTVIHTLQKEPAGTGSSLLVLFQAAMIPVSIALAVSIVLVWMALPLWQLVSNAPARRTSVAIALNQEEDVDFVRPLIERIVQTTGHHWAQWEAPVVTRYDPGAIFAKHGDASPTLGSEWKDEGGQRVITCICYLNDCSNGGGGGGGETYFDQLRLAVRPEPGKALIFFPADFESLRADDRTTHESLPPIDTEKWIVQLFGRVGPRVPPPLGLPDSFLLLMN